MELSRVHLFVATSLILFVAGCTNNHNEDSIPRIELENSVVDVSDDSGVYNVGCTVTTPLAGVDILAQSDTAWITDVESIDNTTLRFRVLGNPLPEPREGAITLKYPSMESVTLTVRQRACVEPKMTLTITEEEYSSIGVSITPHDKQMRYIVMMAEREYFSELNITDTQSLIANDLAYFQSYMTESDTDFESYALNANITLQGDNSKRWESLSPATEYVVYTYGVELNESGYTQLTPVYYTLIENRMPERTTIDFDIEITADGPEVNFDIMPQGWDGYYMVQLVADDEAGYIAQGTTLDETFEEAVAESFFYLSDNLYYFYQHSAEEIMQMLGYRGHATFHKTLNANHKFMAIVYAIAAEEDNIPMVVSKPIVRYFATGDVMMSDITFDVQIENIKPRSADITITPSNNNETYSAVIMYAHNLPDGTPAEQLEYVLERYSIYEIQGVYKESVDGLQPNSEFILAIFGVYAGTPTTDLIVHSFKTPKEGDGSNRITAVDYTAYDLQEVVALESYYSSMVGYGEYFLSVEITTEQPTERVYFDIFSASSFEENGEKWVRESLLDYSYHSLFDWALCIYDNRYVICGLAEDSNGNVGEMFISEYISFAEGETGDAAEFVERYKEYTE